MATGVLKIATCQFAVSSSIKRNALQIHNFLGKAKKLRADIVHFSECALSGYVGTDFGSFDGFDWPLLISSGQKNVKFPKFSCPALNSHTLFYLYIRK